VIAKIRKGRDVGGLARYLFGAGRREEHVDPRTVAGDQVLLGDPRQWATWVADMRFCAGLRPDVARPVWHCSLRTAPEDPVLDDARWAAIARQHITAMGLAGHPWVAVRHGSDHVHIVACRVNATGAVWRDGHDYARAMRSARAIEARYGLARLDRRGAAGRLASTTAAERAQAVRRGTDPERARLRDAMHTALTAAAGAGVAGWERELAARGVLYRAVTTPVDTRSGSRDRAHVGTVMGYRVSLPGWTDLDGKQVWLKASQVDRALSWTRVHPHLVRGDVVHDVEHRAGGTGTLRDRPPRHVGDAPRRAHRTAADLAGEATEASTVAGSGVVGRSFRPLPKVPVVTRGDAEELLQVLLIRLRQWGRDTPPPRHGR
jgi:relaxase-like protein